MGRSRALLRGVVPALIAPSAPSAAPGAASHHRVARKRSPPCGEAETLCRFLRASWCRRRRECGSGRRRPRTSSPRTRRSGPLQKPWAWSSSARHRARSVHPRAGPRASGPPPARGGRWGWRSRSSAPSGSRAAGAVHAFGRTIVLRGGPAPLTLVSLDKHRGSRNDPARASN